VPAKPPLPDGYDFPERVNDWQFDPDSSYNGHAWYGPDRERSVVVFAGLGSANAKVHDERVSGSGSYVELASVEYDRDDRREAVAEMVEQAVAWMQETAPEEWSHPEVNEAVFDAPPGYEFDGYSRGHRETFVYYRRKGASPRKRLAGAGSPDEATAETYPYLVVQMWQGSGNASVDLAPWRYEHDHERESVVDLPEECGLDKALSAARDHAIRHVENDAGPPSVGQTALSEWGETA
jgi:hypothetical protein